MCFNIVFLKRRSLREKEMVSPRTPSLMEVWSFHSMVVCELGGALVYLCFLLAL